MLERAELILKIACVVLAALVLYEVSQLALRWNPLGKTRIPALPTLAEQSESPATNKIGTGHAGSPADKTSTNAAVTHTNHPTTTNAPSNTKTSEDNASLTSKTNAASELTNAEPKNQVAGTRTNSGPTNASATPLSVAAQPGSRSATNAGAMAESELASTNTSPTSKPVVTGTNLAATNKTSGSHSNKLAVKGPLGMSAQAAPHTPKSVKPPTLSSNEETQVSWVVQSELLAPVMHPQPMALLGIGGDYALLRAPNGQTGVIKTGEEVGDIKLLRIGINRVLVEEKGEQKELTIFGGYGGESLLPKKTKKAL